MPKIKQATKKSGRARKEQIVAQLVEKLEKSNGLVFADYRGLTHRQLENLKKELKKQDCTITIAKNSLLKLALEKSPPNLPAGKAGAQPFSEKIEAILQNPTATMFINADYAEPLKKIQKAIKDFGLPKIKFGILEGQLLDESGVLKIASLPGRQILLTQLVGTLSSPIQGLVVTLNANIQKLAIVLDQIKNQKPATTETQNANETQKKNESAASN